MYFIAIPPTMNAHIAITVSFKFSTFFLPQQQVVYDLVIINIIITYFGKDYMQLFVCGTVIKVYNKQ